MNNEKTVFGCENICRRACGDYAAWKRSERVDVLPVIFYNAFKGAIPILGIALFFFFRGAERCRRKR